MSNKHLLKVKRIHPKEFKLKHGLSVSEIHELSDYPPETLKHWLADEHSSRYQQPKESVLNHFGLLDLYLSAFKIQKGHTDTTRFDIVFLL